LDHTRQTGRVDGNEERSIDLCLCEDDCGHQLWDPKMMRRSAGHGPRVEFLSARYRAGGIADPTWKPLLEWTRVMSRGSPFEAQALLAVGESRMVEDKIRDELCVAAWTIAESKIAELRVLASRAMHTGRRADSWASSRLSNNRTPRRSGANKKSHLFPPFQCRS
jgi:hypothetical protein